MTAFNEFIGRAVLDSLDGDVDAFKRAGGQVDIADDGPEEEPSTFTGDQGNADIRAVQLRAENFSPAMVAKAGRLFVEQSYAIHFNRAGCWDIRGDSGDVHVVRVWGGERVWFATCTCPARASRHNRAGACAHRALGAWLKTQQSGKPIPRWPALTLEEWT